LHCRASGVPKIFATFLRDLVLVLVYHNDLRDLVSVTSNLEPFRLTSSLRLAGSQGLGLIAQGQGGMRLLLPGAKSKLFKRPRMCSMLVTPNLPPSLSFMLPFCLHFSCSLVHSFFLRLMGSSHSAHLRFLRGHRNVRTSREILTM